MTTHHHGIDVELDTDDLSHQAWFARLQALLVNAPQGVVCEQDKPFELRQVTVDELVRYMKENRWHTYHMRGDAERLWGVMVRVCGKMLDADVPADREEAKTFPMPLKVLKQVERGHFVGTSTATRTQDTILKFIESL